VHDYHRYFVPTSEGRQEIRITPGPVQASTLPICGYGIDLDRELVVTEDTTLRYRLPELIGVTVIALDEDGSPLQTQPVIQGVTTVETESGTESHRFDAGDSCRSGGVVTGPTGVVGVRVPQPDVANVQTAWWPEPIGEASGLRLQDGDVVVVQRGHSTRGDGVPYAWLQPADSLVYGSERVLGWRPVSTDAVEFTQRVATPFGSTSESPLPSWNGGIAEPLTVPYPNGATTCVRGEATRADGESTESAWVCRTRPVDDREFEASEAWTRVRDDNAYGGSFVAASKRGSRLELRGLAIPAGERPGEVSLIAYTGQDAGTVRLRVAGQWVSAPLSLRGPGIGRPTELTVPLYWQWADTAVRGRLEVVVVSDGQRVRVDGLAWPVPPGQPFLPPL
jgi:hypothetical protein